MVKNKGNLNNHIGLPLSLMQLRHAPDVAVMELGMNHAGEISTLVEIAAPDVRVWTNVGDAHLGFFASADAIADAKGEILERADAGTVLVCNADDQRVMSRAARFPGQVLTFGEAGGATVRARDIRDRGIRGMSADIQTPAGERTIETALLGRGNLMNVLAATAVALECGISLDDIANEIARLQPADRRGAVRSLRRDITLIDDSYNSSPTALRRALEVVAHEARDTRAIAVLGEMLELGDHSIAHARSVRSRGRRCRSQPPVRRRRSRGARAGQRRDRGRHAVVRGSSTSRRVHRQRPQSSQRLKLAIWFSSKARAAPERMS